MSDLDARFHEAWLGLVQPTEGLVVSIPALCDARCSAAVKKDVVERFAEPVRGLVYVWTEMRR